eukprot:CAMPEP_0172493204 /NCGR_PEP_ID=MMETSP1066-20121228/24584_1 /TAXON_ID=671091 /ORGANISM="Coscinodiscus wailesii, Strain CCMP2513" /LENGTH=239 /DNA_ID=CAMNT_0013263253 /DNA_START=44 /DNA_END=763 /DNA_ORIENTATION=-
MRSPNATILIFTVLLSLRQRTISNVNAETATTQEHEQRLRGLSTSDSPRKLLFGLSKGKRVYEAALMEACPGGSTPSDEWCLDEDGSDKCPQGSECLPHPDPKGQPVCCVRDRIVPNPEIKKCVNGTEIPDLFCGKGPNRVPCPEGSYCDIDVADRYAVCCEPKNTTFSKLAEDVTRCINGTEIPGLFCGRGRNHTDCPKGSYCEIHPTDMYAVCCDDTNTTFGTSYPTPSPTSQGTNI